MTRGRGGGKGRAPQMEPSMNLFADIRALVTDSLEALAAQGALPPGLELTNVAVEPPREWPFNKRGGNGDYRPVCCSLRSACEWRRSWPTGRTRHPAVKGSSHGMSV